MANWYPTALKTALGNDSGSFVAGYAKKGVLHTTEGSSASGAIGAYRNINAWPHFTVDQLGNVYQHIPLDKAARALENPPGGVETNRGGAIQIEVVGFASKPVWPEAQKKAMRALMRWIESQTGIKPEGVKFGSSEQFGLKNPLEFPPNTWITYNGWCGHQHVPENSHWDPGAINIYDLLPTQEVKPMFDPPLILEPIAAYLFQNGGIYQVATTGALYAFGAPGIRGPNGEPYFQGRKAAELYKSDDPVIPANIPKAPGGVTIRATSGEWYGPFLPS